MLLFPDCDSAVIEGLFFTGDSVTVSVTDLVTRQIQILTDEECLPDQAETDIFYWSFLNLENQPDQYGFYRFVMVNQDGRKQRGLVTISSKLSDIREAIRAVNVPELIVTEELKMNLVQPPQIKVGVSEVPILKLEPELSPAIRMVPVAPAELKMQIPEE